jgi:hypothetical protein
MSDDMNNAGSVVTQEFVHALGAAAGPGLVNQPGMDHAAGGTADQLDAFMSELVAVRARLSSIEAALGLAEPLAEGLATLLPDSIRQPVSHAMAKLPVIEETVNGILDVIHNAFGPHTGSHLPSSVADAAEKRGG